jgi:hypothetical protein
VDNFEDGYFVILKEVKKNQSKAKVGERKKNSSNQRRDKVMASAANFVSQYNQWNNSSSQVIDALEKNIFLCQAGEKVSRADANSVCIYSRLRLTP